MQKLTSRHFLILVIGATGASLLNYQSLFIGVGGNNTWIFTIAASLILLLLTIYMFSIMKREKAYNFKEVCYYSLGKVLGNIALILFSISLILVCIESVSVSSSAIHTNIFIDTPLWFSIVLFILTAFFISKNRFNSILMVTTGSMFIVIVIGIIVAILNQRYNNFSILKPILHNINIGTYFNSTLMQLGSISSIFILLPFLERIDDRVNLNKYTYIGLCAILLAICLSMINVLASFGAVRSSNIFYPQFVQAQRIYFGGFIEDGQFFIIITSLLFWIVKYILAMFSLYSLWREKISNKTVFIGIISFIVCIISMMLSPDTYNLFNLLYYYQYILLVVLLILPLIIYFIFSLKNKGKNK